VELTESLAPRLGGLEVENQAPDFFQRARTEVGLFRWTASYELFVLHSFHRSKLFTSVSVAKEHADRYVTTQCLWTGL